MRHAWNEALSRKLPSVAKRLRTLTVAPDGRIFVATDAVVTALHCAAALSVSASPIDRTHSSFHPHYRPLYSERSVRAPAIAHQFVCVNHQEQLRKDTLLSFTDVVSVAVLHCGFVAVVFADGTLHVFAARLFDECEGGWGGAWPAWHHFPVLLAPAFDLKCICTAAVLVPSTRDGRRTPSVRHTLVVARESGVYVYDEDDVKVARDEAIPHLVCLSNEWSNVLHSCDTVPVAYDESITLIAVAHQHGKLALHSLSAGETAEQRLQHSLLWRTELSAPITSISFCAIGARKATLVLAVAVGNDFLLVEWGDSRAIHKEQWHQPVVSRVEQAHESLLSAAQIIADGSVLSAGTDGKLLRWSIQDMEKHGSEQSMSNSVILEPQEDVVEPIMGAMPTLNGFGVLVLATNFRSRTEVGEPSKGNIRKYLGSGRRSSISLLTLPMPDDVSALDEAIGKCIQRFLSATWMCRGISMWDIELFVGGHDNEKNGLTEKLRIRYEWLLEIHNHVEKGRPSDKEEHPVWLRSQRAMVLLWLGRVIARSGTVNIDEIDRLNRIASSLRRFLFCMHFDMCIRHVLAQGDCVKQFTEMDLRSLESMCEFVSVCSSVTCDSAAMQQRVMEARGLMQDRIDAEGCSATFCPICECEDEQNVLVGEREHMIDFKCSNEDTFVRCVKSGLPVTDVVPLQCMGCEARAIRHDFNWIKLGNKCSLCHCDMLTAKVECI
ncbi:hypothetical protein FGB62_29g113 [Gracilaria domingensis]|nr:hypothetical protein FGB62_29g113 [Gracilaria domingensis]